jgi:acylphosphatase
MNGATVIRRVVISGRVQGVGYRAWTEHVAGRRGLAGWVRNRRDGSVEALFVGSSDEVAAMIAACREGPRGSVVDHVSEHDAEPDLLTRRYAGELFSVLPTE